MQHPSPGFSSPKSVRGLHSSGLIAVSIHNIADLNKIKTKDEGALIGRTVGMKKRSEIIKKAIEKKIKILNLKDPESYLENINKKMESRKKRKVERNLKVEKKGKIEKETSSKKETKEKTVVMTLTLS